MMSRSLSNAVLGVAISRLVPQELRSSSPFTIADNRRSEEDETIRETLLIYSFIVVSVVDTFIKSFMQDENVKADLVNMNFQF